MLPRKQYLIIAAPVLIAIVVSFFLIPSSQELALMQLKDKHFEDARAAYEKELAAGTLNMEVANNLSDLYLQKGNINKAIETMEKFVAAHPGNLEARIKLGTLYQYDQRTDQYMNNLEAINKIRPNTNDLSNLSYLYNFKGDYDKQAQVLRELIAAEKGKNPKHFSDLANIQASRHDYAGAIDTLSQLRKSDPEHFTFANEVLLVSLLFDNRQPEDAKKTLESWLDKSNNIEEAAELINIAHFKGSAAMAENLMSRYSEDKIDANPKLLEAYIYLKLSENADDAIFRRLEKLHKDKKLPPALAGNLLLLAVERGETELSQDLMKDVPLNTMPEQDVLKLIEMSITEDDSDLLNRINQSFSDEESRKLYPVISAALAVASQHQDAPELLSRLDTLGFTHEQTLEIADICAHFNRSLCATHLLANLPDQSQLSDSEIATIGDIYLQLHEADNGYNYIAGAGKNRDKSPAIGHVYILLQAARGKDSEVKSWLDTHPEMVNEHLLTDLFYAAYDNSRFNTAVHMAQIFRGKYESELGRSLLAAAYVAAKQYEQAVKTLRGISGGNMLPEDEDTYLTALVKLAPWRKEYRKELVTFANTQLNSGTLSEKQKIAVLHALIDVNETGLALPHFKAQALAAGGEWTMLYAQLLDKKGRYDEARPYWVKALNDPKTATADKEDIAYVLIDHGFKSDAEPVFMQLAEHAGAKSTPVSELMYIWGPKPAATRVEWLERRYNAEFNPAEKRLWAALIGNAGSTAYLEGFVTRHPETIAVPEVADTYFEALAEEGKLAGKSAYYAGEAKRTGNTILLKKYASMAQDFGLRDDARKAYEEITALEPGNYMALRETGISAFEQADYTSARKYLGQYINQYKPEDTHDPKAYLAYFYYAETLRKDQDRKVAEPYYRKALSLMENSPVPQTPENIKVKAQSQIWAGDEAAGIKTLDAALQDYPQNPEIRQNMADILIEIGHYGNARSVIAGMPGWQSGKHKLLTSMDLPGLITPIKNLATFRHNHELLITFTRPVATSDIKKLKDLPWVSYISDGYDAVLIVTLPEFKFHIDSNKLHLAKDEVMNEAPVQDALTKSTGESK